MKAEGVGIGLRREHFDEVLTSPSGIDWLEVIPESYMGLGGRAPRALDACRDRFTLVPHGVALSIGGPDSMDRYLDALGPFLDRIGADVFSEHLSWSSAQRAQTFDLLPLPFNDEAVEHVATRAKYVAKVLGRPLVLENITYYAEMPGSTMSDTEFVRRVIAASGCGLLLDLNNLWINAHNHGRDALADLDALPLDAVRQIHLAGANRDEDLWLDTHDRPVADPVWALLAEVTKRVGVVPTLIEWDQAVPPLADVVAEVRRARATIEAASSRAA